MSFQLKGLREKRGQIRAKLAELGDKLKTESRAMTADEKTAFDKLKADWVAVGDSIRTVEADIQAVDAVLNADAADDAGANSDAGSGDATQQNSKRDPRMIGRSDTPRANPNAAPKVDTGALLRAWFRTGAKKKLTAEQRAACEAAGFNPKAKHFSIRLGASRGMQKRDQSVGTASAGGYGVAQDFSYKLDRALKAFSNVRGVCPSFTSATGADMPYPTLDDTSNIGELLAENTNGIAPTDLTFGVVTFKGYKYSTKGLLVSNEFLNDESIDLETVIADALGERLGRIQGTHFTTGDNSSKPQGIVTAAGTGVTAVSATTFTSDELINLFFKVDPAYRASDNFGWMMNDAVVAFVTLLKDSQGRPLYQQSFREGAPDTILGKPLHTNQFMDSAFTTGKKLVLAGDFNKYLIRDIGTLRMRRLEERYAEKDQVGFIGFLRSDGRALNAAALKLLVLA